LNYWATFGLGILCGCLFGMLGALIVWVFRRKRRKLFLDALITDECIERLRRNEVEEIQLPDQILRLKYKAKSPRPPGAVGRGCFVFTEPGEN
jgi:hypothetical protein